MILAQSQVHVVRVPDTQPYTALNDTGKLLSKTTRKLCLHIWQCTTQKRTVAFDDFGKEQKSDTSLMSKLFFPFLVSDICL